MTANEAIEYIENQTWSTTRLGLERTRELLHKLGDPQKKLKFIHVAGSNGKGSTCAMLDSIFRAAGYKTGLYTSPYIQDFCERARVNGKNIPHEALARLTERVKAIAETMADHPSQFELMTAIAMEYFYEEKCDIVVLEVGMGGALDSTNAIDAPECAVICNIGLEHTEYLGSTLTEIASAKGGIIKPGCTAVLYDSVPEAMATLEGICKKQNVPYFISRADDVKELSHSLDGQRFTWKNAEYSVPLLGAHQLRNAATALEAISAMRQRGWDIPESAVISGLASVKWPARCELLNKKPVFLLDGGHNPQCAAALCKTLDEYFPGRKFTFLLGILADKDYDRMLDMIRPHAERFICVTPDSPRALDAVSLASEAGENAEAAESIDAGVQAAIASGEDIVAFGSLYLAGHVRTVFPKLFKKHQRTEALSRRDELPESLRREYSLTICRNIESTEEYKNAQNILIFRAFGSEADLDRLARDAAADGKKVFYPRCIDKTHMLAMFPDGRFEKGRFGIEEPASDSPVIEPEKLDLIICPCSAFDSGCRRLGMGAGYYDRFLPHCDNSVVFLAAFEAQRVDRVYTDEHDVTMDAVITEKGVYRREP